MVGVRRSGRGLSVRKLLLIFLLQVSLHAGLGVVGETIVAW